MTAIVKRKGGLQNNMWNYSEMRALHVHKVLLQNNSGFDSGILQKEDSRIWRRQNRTTAAAAANLRARQLGLFSRFESLLVLI